MGITGSNKMRTLEEILSNTKLDPATGCRIWLGGKFAGGYGCIWWQGKPCEVHRVVWALIHGDPGALDVLHTCDNRACCEFAHLFLGTQQDNNKDCDTKGRRYHKLTEAQVREIRALLARGCASQGQLSKRYGVSRQTLSNIARNRYWKCTL